MPNYSVSILILFLSIQKIERRACGLDSRKLAGSATHIFLVITPAAFRNNTASAIILASFVKN